MRVSLLAAATVLAGSALHVGVSSAQVSSPAPLANQALSVSPADLIRRAFDANRDLAAARLDLERGRARLRQAGLRPNPTLDVQRMTGQLTGSPDERELTVGVALPLEIGGRRERRIDVAAAELAVIEADIANRERQLARDVLAAYIDAVAATRELQTTERLLQLDQQLAGVVRTRVEQQDAPPLELSLLLTETARLQSRMALIRGRVDAALIAIGQLVGAPMDPMTVDPSTGVADILPIPTTVDTAIAMALERRADIAVAKLTEQAAEAGVRLARAEAFPEVTVSAAYITGRGLSELPAPLVAVPDDDKTLAFGASVGLPFFNKNQGARAEAAVAVRQAQLRREATEQTVRAEVTSAFSRVAAARSAIALFEQGVLPRSDDNVRIMRAAYELGEFRITEVLNEQRRLLDAQQEYMEAVAEHYRAVVDLRAALGSTGLQP